MHPLENIYGGNKQLLATNLRLYLFPVVSFYLVPRVLAKRNFAQSAAIMKRGLEPRNDVVYREQSSECRD